MTAIELFQLTMIPAHMLESERWITRICARLMGVQFSFLDLLAYGVGIGCIYFVDRLADSEGKHLFELGLRRLTTVFADLVGLGVFGGAALFAFEFQ